MTNPTGKPSPAKSPPSRLIKIVMEPKTPGILKTVHKVDWENFYRPNGTRKRRKWRTSSRQKKVTVSVR